MRHSFRLAFFGAALLGVVVALACGESALPVDLDPATDAGPRPSTTETRPGDPDSGPPMSTMRLAHLAPGLGPIDFCYQAARGGSLEGPVLGSAAAPQLRDASTHDADTSSTDAAVASDASLDATDAGAILPAAYRNVSKYLNLTAAGPITIAVVEAGATSCGSPIAKATVTLDPGKLSTVALFGTYGADDSGAAGLTLAAFTDDRTTLPESARVRVIHAALGTSTSTSSGVLAVRAVASKTTLLTDRVEPRRTSSESKTIGVDALGYVTIPPVPPPTAIAIGPAMRSGGADSGFDPWQSAPQALDLRGGSLHTAFLLSGAAEDSFELLWCADTTTSGDQTTCTLVR